MKCEGCKSAADGYDLHDYCAACSKNLCAKCMTGGRCRDSNDQKHHAANHGEANETAGSGSDP